MYWFRHFSSRHTLCQGEHVLIYTFLIQTHTLSRWTCTDLHISHPDAHSVKVNMYWFTHFSPRRTLCQDEHVLIYTFLIQTHTLSKWTCTDLHISHPDVHSVKVNMYWLTHFSSRRTLCQGKHVLIYTFLTQTHTLSRWTCTDLHISHPDAHSVKMNMYWFTHFSSRRTLCQGEHVLIYTFLIQTHTLSR